MRKREDEMTQNSPAQRGPAGESEVREITLEGWRCALVRLGAFELTIPLEFGPRILACRFEGGENLFHQSVSDKGKKGGDTWRSYGGHRLWMAPEDYATTYYPDNEPITLSQSGQAVTISAPVEKTSGLRKRLTLTALSSNELSILHRFDNLGDRSMHCAPWAITVLDQGAIGLAALPTRGKHGDHLLPTGSLTLWAYTVPNDPRLTWHDRFVSVEGRDTPHVPVKVGFGYGGMTKAWVGAITKGVVFRKEIDVHPGVYPDRDSCVEIFTEPGFLEVETLGPLVTLTPGRSTEHEERWMCSKYDAARGVEGAYEVCLR